MMRHTFKVFVGTLIMTTITAGAFTVMAQDEGSEEFSLTVMPGRYVAVQGDEKKFRALNWINDGYAGGIKELLYSKEKGDTSFSFEGRAIPQDFDKKALIDIDKSGLGFFSLHYKAFRKYYDPTGGTYYPMTDGLSATDSDQELEMDISHMLVEVGTDVENSNGVSLLYERHAKEGKKSRLTWAAADDGVSDANIAPGWQDVNEVTDAVALKGFTELGGFDVKGEQRYEVTKIASFREEKKLASTGVLGDTIIRRQNQEPETTILTSNLLASRWFSDETSYLSMGYRFQKLDNEELEDLLEYDQFNNPVCVGGNCKNKFNATADNELDAHTIVSQFLTNPTKNLSFIAKFKGEFIDKEGTSLYPNDTTNPPDGVANHIDFSRSDDNVERFGQNFSIRYAGIPRTNVYAEIEVEETDNDLTELLVNLPGSGAASSGGDFSRRTLTSIKKTAWTLGSRSVPSRQFNFTTQYRQKYEDNDYDDQYETSGGGSARSAFVDSLKITGREATTKLTWKPLDWLQSSFRYQYLKNDYQTRFDNADATIETDLKSHVFTYDLFLQPLDQLLLNFSYSFQDMKVATPAGSATTAQQPGFNSDVHSLLFSASYTPSEHVNYVGTFNYSFTDNFNDFTAIGVPMGTDYTMYNGTLEMNWKLKDDLKLSPHYGYYRYDSNPLIDSGDYSAHVAWLDVTKQW